MKIIKNHLPVLIFFAFNCVTLIGRVDKGEVGIKREKHTSGFALTYNRDTNDGSKDNNS